MPLLRMATGTLVLFAACVGCGSEARQREQFVKSHPDLSPAVRDGILSAKVVIGMTAEEAHAAAGAFVYEIENAPEGVYPPDVIFSKPELLSEDIVFKLRFRTKTQYSSGTPASFVVVFERGRAVRILSPEEEEVEDALSGAVEKQEKGFQETAISWISHVYTPTDHDKLDPEISIAILMNLIRQEGRSNAATNELEGAAAALGRIGKPAVPVLVEALRDERRRVRQYACMALRYMASEAEAALPALQALLRSPDVNDRAGAAATLGRIGRASLPAVVDILPLLREKEIFVRCSALIALGRIGDDSTEVATRLSAALKDSNEEVRRQARIALARIRHARSR